MIGTGPDGEGCALQSYRLDLRDLDRVMTLHAELHRIAPRSGLFAIETEAFFVHHLGPGGMMLGIDAPDGSLAAYSVLGLPGADDAENFGHDIGLGPHDRRRVAHLDGTGIAAAFRGIGLQLRMIAERIALARVRGRSLLMSTAAPANTRSLGNLLEGGLEAVALVDKYESIRFVLTRDLLAPPSPDRSGPAIPLDDHAAHRKAFAEGWCGRGLAPEGAEPALLYGRREEGVAA
jgi:hypothetical protein